MSGRRIHCNTENHVLIVVPGLSTGSSSSITSTPTMSLSQDSVRSTLKVQQAHEVRVRMIKHWETSCENHQKTKSKIKMNTSIKHRETCRAICLNGWKSSHGISWLNVYWYPGTHPQALLANQIQNHREKWYRASTVFYTHFPKDRDCELCRRTKITRAPCRKRVLKAIP